MPRALVTLTTEQNQKNQDFKKKKNEKEKRKEIMNLNNGIFKEFKQIISEFRTKIYIIHIIYNRCIHFM